MTISYTSEEEAHLNYYRAQGDDSLLQPSPYLTVATHASGGTETEIEHEVTMPKLSPTEIRADERRKVLREIESHFYRKESQLWDHGVLCHRLPDVIWQALLAEAGIEEAK